VSHNTAPFTACHLRCATRNIMASFPLHNLHCSTTWLRDVFCFFNVWIADLSKLVILLLLIIIDFFVLKLGLTIVLHIIWWIMAFTISLIGLMREHGIHLAESLVERWANVNNIICDQLTVLCSLLRGLLLFSLIASAIRCHYGENIGCDSNCVLLLMLLLFLIVFVGAPAAPHVNIWQSYHGRV